MKQPHEPTPAERFSQPPRFVHYIGLVLVCGIVMGAGSGIEGWQGTGRIGEWVRPRSAGLTAGVVYGFALGVALSAPAFALMVWTFRSALRTKWMAAVVGAYLVIQLIRAGLAGGPSALASCALAYVVYFSIFILLGYLYTWFCRSIERETHAELGRILAELGGLSMAERELRISRAPRFLQAQLRQQMEKAGQR